MNKEYLTVTQLTKYIKYKIDNDINLREVYLKGEISNFKAHTRGHFILLSKMKGVESTLLCLQVVLVKLNLLLKME